MTKNGFTLIEVLVALAIFGLSIGALVKAQGTSMAGISSLDDRLYAEIVAENVLVDEMTSNRRLTPGFIYGDINLAGRKYYWSLQSRPTGQGDIMLLEVQVRLGEERNSQIIASLSTFRESDP